MDLASWNYSSGLKRDELGYTHAYNAKEDVPDNNSPDACGVKFTKREVTRYKHEDVFTKASQYHFNLIFEKRTS